MTHLSWTSTDASRSLCNPRRARARGAVNGKSERIITWINGSSALEPGRFHSAPVGYGPRVLHYQPRTCLRSPTVDSNPSKQDAMSFRGRNHSIRLRNNAFDSISPLTYNCGCYGAALSIRCGHQQVLPPGMRAAAAVLKSIEQMGCQFAVNSPTCAMANPRHPGPSNATLRI